MKSSLGSLIFSTILISLSCCSKPAHINSESLREEAAPRIMEVQIKDTLPSKFISELGITGTHGLQFSYDDGRQSTYFRYSANRNTVLDALSKLGFSRNSPLADTSCRALTSDQFLSLRDLVKDTEKAEARFFWEIDPRRYEIFECLKAPSHHLVLLEKNSDTVFHLVLS